MHGIIVHALSLRVAINYLVYVCTHKQVCVEPQCCEELSESATPDGKRANITRVNVHIIRNA